MAEFPSREADIMMLASKMVRGYEDHPAVFPHADAAGLNAAHLAFHSAFVTAECYRALERVQTVDKDEALDAMVALMKAELAQSEIDTADDPEMLNYIGWGPAKAPAKVKVPGAPRALEAPVQGDDGSITLDWKRPLDGGPVQLYVVERREADAAGVLGPWKQCGAAVIDKIELRDQSTRVQMEYRVRAMNSSGEGDPCASVSVVL